MDSNVTEGALVLDKPADITSHDAVLAARRVLSERRIGHLGTLDPFATGVLVLLVGSATRLAQFFRERQKTYEGTIRFGYSTDTFDCTGTATSADSGIIPQEEPVRRLFSEFTGTYAQIPPPFSAKKIGGVAAHRLARKEREVRLAPVGVTIHELELVAIDGPLVRFRARVSSGTYLRSLAHDLGERLGMGAHLAALRRTSVGEFTLAAAVPLAQLEEKLRRGERVMIPAAELLPEFPAILLESAAVRGILAGRDVELEAEAPCVRLLDPSGTLCAIGTRVAEGRFHPSVVLRQGNGAGAASSGEALVPRSSRPVAL
jgi:tRNA pseudouridine55 synthase